MNYTFEQRLEALRRRKEEQTQEKIRRNGYMDEDETAGHNACKEGTGMGAEDSAGRRP